MLGLQKTYPPSRCPRGLPSLLEQWQSIFTRCRILPDIGPDGTTEAARVLCVLPHLSPRRRVVLNRQATSCTVYAIIFSSFRVSSPKLRVVEEVEARTSQ